MKKTLLLIATTVLSSITVLAQIHLGTGQTYPNIELAAPNIKPGDTVYLHAGAYAGYQGITALKGTAAKPIVITRYKKDAHTICGCWQFSSCEYIKFQYLNFKGNSSYPGRLINMDNSGDCSKQAKYIQFDSCYFSDVTDASAVTALKFGGVDYFEVTNCVFKNAPNCDLLDFNVCHHGMIRGNYIENTLTAGHIKGGSSDITMEKNIFINGSSGNWVAFEYGGDTDAQFYCPNDTFEVKDLRFHSNIIVGGGRGFALSSAVNCTVTNNTIYNTSGTTFRLLNVSTLYPLNKGNKVENNIFAFSNTSAYMDASTEPSGNPQAVGSTSFSNNIYFSIGKTSFNGPYWESPATDLVKEQSPLTYSSTTNMFVNAAGKDFHLASGSPAIAAGKSETTPAIDYYGYLYKSIRSIGASEYNSTLASVASIKSKTGSFVCYPNPSNTGHITLLSYDANLGAEVHSLSIVSLTGAVVIHKTIQQLPIDVDITELSRGIYFLQLSGEDFVRVEKFVVE